MIVLDIDNGNAGLTCMHEYTLCIKYVTSLHHYNSDIRESTLTIFGTNVIEKVGNQKVLISPLTELLLLLYVVKCRNRKSILSLKCCTAASPDFNQSLV